ncbi:hypothetical protein B0I08_101398 [Glaciihabitans tibetensis]|uniref:Polysaccharide biosynthesis enzyme WcbI domain-containing protein n=1 Tax=Glaciihabitans tibetensis TaxID=1266600 RepID=A0A2T0VJ83_9MICO|nr:WcbI family polysaccharide biosynthesis putative acetyltransferase [Glaciihabitans tibetensis]PRY70268.1 hypothetical protein B0I08_101398 [Glaciihabitans tibetensis]
MSEAHQDVDGRRRHYSQFYGLTDLPTGGYGVVAGNCQAESLRIFLEGGDMPWVRMPAIHELVADDIHRLTIVLGQAAVLVSQPIQDNYRGLPIGTRNLVAALRPAAQTVTVPIIRFAGLYPAQVLIRPPVNPSLSPPIVAYHDLRTLAEAADRLHGLSTPVRPITVASVRAVGDRSLQELRSREARHDTVVVSDLFERPSFGQMRTINHPGNPVWTDLAARVRSALGHEPHTVDPGREVLNNVHAPRLPEVAEAYDLAAPSTPHWVVDEVDVADEVVRDAHLRWYEKHPEVIDAGILRHRGALESMGFTR